MSRCQLSRALAHDRANHGMAYVAVEGVGLPPACPTDQRVLHAPLLQRDCSAFAKAVAAVAVGIVSDKPQQPCYFFHQPRALNGGRIAVHEERGR